MPPDRTWRDHVALVISAVVSPFVVLPTLLLGTTWQVATTLTEFVLWGTVGLLFFVILPPLYIYREVRAGRITDVHVQLREQRATVFAVFLISAALGSTCYWLLGVSSILMNLVIILFLSALVAAMITLEWKISIHAWTVAGSVTAFALLSSNPNWWWGLLAVPLVIWARVHRDRHSPAQGLAGAFVGVVVTWILYQVIG